MGTKAPPLTLHNSTHSLGLPDFFPTGNEWRVEAVLWLLNEKRNQGNRKIGNLRKLQKFRRGHVHRFVPRRYLNTFGVCRASRRRGGLLGQNSAHQVRKRKTASAHSVTACRTRCHPPIATHLQFAPDYLNKRGTCPDFNHVAAKNSRSGSLRPPLTLTPHPLPPPPRTH